MVDKYLTCTMQGCNGVAVALGGDLRSKKITYVCEKCGNSFPVSRQDVEAAKQLLNLGDPGDFMRSGIK